MAKTYINLQGICFKSKIIIHIFWELLKKGDMFHSI